MDEAEWRTCADPKKMLDWLGTLGKVSHRKQLLFACSCCRRIWPLVADERSRQAVETVERFADGRATEEDLAAACSAAQDAYREATAPMGRSCKVPVDLLKAFWAAGTAYQVARLGDDSAAAAEPAHFAAQASLFLPEVTINLSDQQAVDAALAPERAVQAGILRDLVGNSLARDPTWRTPTVLALAQASYDNRQLPSGTLDAQRLIILADCLEEAGCTDSEILGHLRGGPHVRGCFLIDVILDKK
jgi:hypothetical protein